MPIEPPNFQEMLNRLLNPTPTMVKAAELIDSGMHEHEVADLIAVRPEVVLVWHELHLGFQARVALLAQLADHRIANRLNSRNAVLIDVEIDDIEHAAATSTAIAVRRHAYRAAPDRRQRPPSARELLTALVEAEYERQSIIDRDLDMIERDLQTGHKPDRRKIEVNLVESRLAAIKYVEDGEQ